MMKTTWINKRDGELKVRASVSFYHVRHGPDQAATLPRVKHNGGLFSRSEQAALYGSTFNTRRLL